MPDIKTRDVIKGTVKTLDKSAIASQRMKDAYVRTKEKAEHGVYAGESSPDEYATSRLSGGTEAVAWGMAYQFDKQGRKGFEATKENISKAKEHFKKERTTDPLKKQAEKAGIPADRRYRFPYFRYCEESSRHRPTGTAGRQGI